MYRDTQGLVSYLTRSVPRYIRTRLGKFESGKLCTVINYRHALSIISRVCVSYTLQPEVLLPCFNPTILPACQPFLSTRLLLLLANVLKCALFSRRLVGFCRSLFTSFLFLISLRSLCSSKSTSHTFCIYFQKTASANRPDSAFFPTILLEFAFVFLISLHRCAPSTHLLLDLPASSTHIVYSIFIRSRKVPSFVASNAFVNRSASICSNLTYLAPMMPLRSKSQRNLWRTSTCFAFSDDASPVIWLIVA